MRRAHKNTQIQITRLVIQAWDARCAACSNCSRTHDLSVTSTLSTSMAPPKQQNAGGGMKQKSLMGWLAKGPTTPAQQKTKAALTPKTDIKSEKNEQKETAAGGASSAKLKSIDINERTKGFPSSSSVASTKSSSIASDPAGLKSTPPTSDPIDVDMQSDDEDGPISVAKRGKRKIVAGDSDDDLTMKTNRKSSSAAPSSDAGKSSPSNRGELTCVLFK